MQIPPPQTVDPNVPAQIPPDRLQDLKGFLDVMLETVVGGAAPDVLALGLQLWGGLATVVVAWTGLRIAFSGTFEPWALVRLVLAVAIPRTILHYYSLPIPGVGFSFPATIAAGGVWLQNLFVSDVVSVGYTEITALVQAFAAGLGAAWSSGSLVAVVTEGVSVFLSSVLTLLMGVPIVLGLVALFSLTYAQVIWAQVALAIVVLLGPVFIPWLLFEPMSFLFWGWFRTLLTYTLYGVVAGAVLRVFMGVGMGYVTTYTGALMGTGPADPAELGLWVVVLLPLIVSGLIAGLKVGEVAAILVSGSGSVGSGFMALVVRGRGSAASSPARAAAAGAGN
ncbi:MAG: type IV secretion system protein [Gammaproteobacteria bacterium]|nr:type IV secretion system protein [Gammaproteobacteria bacterium]